MKRKTAIERVVGSYRLVFVMATVVMAIVALFTTFSVLRSGFDAALSLPLLLLRIATAITLVALLWWGHSRLRRALGEAEDEQRQQIDDAHRDALTGAFTRAHFLSLLGERLRPGGSPVAYLQLDMDNLKVINDSLGHAAGDAALVQLARVLREMFPAALVGRLGGDEFAVAIAGGLERSELVALGDGLLARLGEPAPIDGRELRLSATVGFARWPEDAETIDELISRADLALYKGKRNGRAATVPFDAAVLAAEQHKRFVEAELRAAMELGQLELHYQPIFSTNGRGILAHEALVRWQHPVRGLISPADFIPVAEQSDLIDHLGAWVLARVGQDMARLVGPVGVNVSAVQLRRGDFFPRFAAALEAGRLDPARLVVEVTETLPLATGSAELASIEALRALGIKVAIDDFGAGFASLEYLRRFPFDIIKIDRSYIASLPAGRIERLVVAALCEIGRSLGVEVVAEGVETEAQREFLTGAGCTALQGFLLARPLPLPRPGERPAASRVASAA